MLISTLDTSLSQQQWSLCELLDQGQGISSRPDLGKHIVTTQPHNLDPLSLTFCNECQLQSSKVTQQPFIEQLKNPLIQHCMAALSITIMFMFMFMFI